LKYLVLNIVFVLFFLSISIIGFGQDSTKTKIKTTYSTLANIAELQDSFMRIDSNLFIFHQYNKASNYENFTSNLGSIGSPVFSRTLDYSTELGFDMGLNHFNVYKLTANNFRYFNSYSPYTEFHYVQGANSVQMFRAVFSRNITSWWNATVEYNGLTSDGIYYNQKNKHKSFGGNTWIKTKNSRYQVYFSAIKNTFDVHENGGIVDDSLFESFNNGNKKRTNVNLYYSKQEYTEKNYCLDQILNLGKNRLNIDSNYKSDPEKNPFRKPFNLNLKFNYFKKKYKYISDLTIEPTYYQNVFFDSNTTYDEITNKQYDLSFLLNKAFGKLEKDNEYNFFVRGGARYVEGNSTQDTIDSNYQYYSAVFKISKKVFFLRINVEGEYILKGNYTGNYNLKAIASYDLSQNFRLQLGTSQICKSPSIRETDMISNHLVWHNDYTSYVINGYFLSVTSVKFHLFFKAAYNTISDWIYYTEDLLPLQTDQKIGYYSLQLKKELKLGKFHFDNNILYQYSSNNIISLPEFQVNNCTYYESLLFKKNLHFQAGFSVFFHNSYYADGYYTPYSIFYNQEKVLVKSYPMIDVFVNLGIKRMRVFLKYEHINQGFPDYYGFTAPHYPVDPRVFRFGFAWLFFD
jgi:hypothetical protein